MSATTTSDRSVHKATGKVWDEWFSELERINAGKLSHKDIAAMLVDDYEVSAWWAQSITVEYERFIGRREAGQSCEGDYQAGASKTLPGTMDEIFEGWLDYVAGKDSLNNDKFAEAPSTSKTEKWRYWRVPLQGGSKVNVIINQKDQGKVHLAVNHEKLPDNTAVDAWKKYWRGCFAEFKEQL